MINELSNDQRADQLGIQTVDSSLMQIARSINITWKRRGVVAIIESGKHTRLLGAPVRDFIAVL